jgi:hypothetical protein
MAPMDEAELGFPGEREDFGPVLAEGECAGWRWRFRGSIRGADALKSFSAQAEEGGGGSGGKGALPFATVGDRTLGHIGSWGSAGPAWVRGPRSRGPRSGPRHVDGVVSLDVRRVIVHTSGGPCDAPASHVPTSVSALDDRGRELEHSEVPKHLRPNRFRRWMSSVKGWTTAR